MNQTIVPSPQPWLDYRTVWRWHFYAGLFCIPFVCWLAVTGSIYLFKPQVEAWLDRPYEKLALPQTAAPSRSVQAALAANPGWTLHAYELPRTAHSAARVIIGRGGEERRVYVDRGSLQVLKSISEDRRPMRVIFLLHGELLWGDRGSMLVELAASWAIVMIITGLYLWWPRQARGLAGLAYPRLGAGKRLFWRDLHAVTGVWVSVLALLMLLSGLPWSKNWGGYLKDVRRFTGTAAVHQDWTTGLSSEIAARKTLDAAGMSAMSHAEGEHAGHGHRSAAALSPQALLALDRVTPPVALLDLAPPVLISPPTIPNGPWSAKSDAQNRTLRADLKLDPGGAILSRIDFSQRDPIDRITGMGIAAHEGQLFGWPNQMLGLFIAASLLTVSISAVVLWWRRRDAGALGAPLPQGHPRFCAGLAAVVGVLGLLLPLFGLSLVLVALTERLILRRLPLVQQWLGLRAA